MQTEEMYYCCGARIITHIPEDPDLFFKQFNERKYIFSSMAYVFLEITREHARKIRKTLKELGFEELMRSKTHRLFVQTKEARKK